MIDQSGDLNQTFLHQSVADYNCIDFKNVVLNLQPAIEDGRAEMTQSGISMN